MKRLGLGLLGTIAGYAIGVGVGLALVSLFSGNAHDKAVESAVTAAFVTGPLGALIGAGLGILAGRKKKAGSAL